MMGKGDTINAIRSINRSASSEFLSDFAGDELSDYLVRLRNVARNNPMDDLSYFLDMDGPPPHDSCGRDPAN